MQTLFCGCSDLWILNDFRLMRFHLRSGCCERFRSRVRSLPDGNCLKILLAEVGLIRDSQTSHSRSTRELHRRDMSRLCTRFGQASFF